MAQCAAATAHGTTTPSGPGMAPRNSERKSWSHNRGATPASRMWMALRDAGGEPAVVYAAMRDERNPGFKTRRAVGGWAARVGAGSLRGWDDVETKLRRLMAKGLCCFVQGAEREAPRLYILHIFSFNYSYWKVFRQGYRAPVTLSCV